MTRAPLNSRVVVPDGFVRFEAREPRIAVQTRMDGTAPVLVDGDVGWEEVPRALRTALTSWRGHAPRRQRIGLLFDGYQRGVPVERAIHNLKRLARAQPGMPHPPVLRISGLVERTDLEWVIGSIEPGDNVIRDARGRLRQDFAVELVEYVPGKLVIVDATPGQVSRPRLAIVRPRDTLKSMAQRTLGDGTRWREIQAMNIAVLGKPLDWRLPTRLVGKYLKVPAR